MFCKNVVSIGSFIVRDVSLIRLPLLSMREKSVKLNFPPKIN